MGIRLRTFVATLKRFINGHCLLFCTKWGHLLLFRKSQNQLLTKKMHSLVCVRTAAIFFPLLTVVLLGPNWKLSIVRSKAQKWHSSTVAIPVQVGYVRKTLIFLALVCDADDLTMGCRLPAYRCACVLTCSDTSTVPVRVGPTVGYSQSSLVHSEQYCILHHRSSIWYPCSPLHLLYNVLTSKRLIKDTSWSDKGWAPRQRFCLINSSLHVHTRGRINR